MNSNINEAYLEKIFSRYYVVDPPKNIIVLDKPAVSVRGSSMSVFRGLAPKWRNDIIVITPQGNDETLLHEAFHAQFGAGESAARVVGKLLVVKTRFIDRSNFISSRFRGRTVNYQRCPGCELEKELDKTLLIISPPDSNPIHYKLV